MALGGGGVRGLAHILILEVLDEMGCKPCAIAGTSMGAIIGAMYASGMSGREIRKGILDHMILKDDHWRDLVRKKENLLKWIDAFAPTIRRGGLLRTDGFLKYFLDEIKKATFEELETPLTVVAGDFWTGEEVVIQSGKLLPAIQASMAIPGVFTPVPYEGRVLVDGGVVNLVPYDHLLDRVDVTIAVDVSTTRDPGGDNIPHTLDAILGSLDILQAAALAERMKHRKPDIMVRPAVRGVGILDFNKIEEVFRQAVPAVDALREQLQRLT